jgi:hypothetical protein
MLKSSIINMKADRNDPVSLYDSVDRVIPWRVARQHCPTLFDRGTKKINNLEDTIYKFLRGSNRYFVFAALVACKSNKKSVRY